MATYYSTVTDPATTAQAYGRDMPCSPKSGRNVARAIKGMPVARAKDFLASVTRLETPVPFKVRNRKIHHRKGTGFGPGKYPVQTVKCFLKVLESAEANAEYKGLDKERLVITHTSAYQGTVIQAFTPRAQGRATPHYNRLCNFEVILTQLDSEAHAERQEKAEKARERRKGKATKAAAKPKAKAAKAEGAEPKAEPKAAKSTSPKKEGGN
jgi:large subunit ribosomal protein L22